MKSLKIAAITLVVFALITTNANAQKGSTKSKKTTETKTTQTKTTEKKPNGTKTTETKTTETKTTDNKTEPVNKGTKSSSTTTSGNSTTTTETKTSSSFFDDLKDKAKDLGKSVGLSNEDASLGVKDALLQGIRKGVGLVSVTDGFFKNPAIKIPMPKEAEVVETTLRKVGLGSKVDEAVLSMNRGAEDAAKSATNIFVDAITQMSVTDAINIIKGNDNACTQYLQNKSTSSLKAAFNPIVEKSLEKTQATKYWSELMTAYNKVPFVKKVNPNLTEYVTDKAIEGLFKMVAQEEVNIRKNPAMRTTDILKKVFGS